MEGYSVTEAASVLGVPTERVWELLARGVLAGAPEGETGMRVFLQPRPVPAPSDARMPNGDGGSREPERELSPFRELLTEFRNLTERYGQALLALGESRGEVAALRSRVDMLEARIELRLPSTPAPAPGWSSTPMPAVAERAVMPTAPVAPPPLAEPTAEPTLEPGGESMIEAEEGEEEHRARPRGPRRATESFAEALARAEDPSIPELPGGSEAAAAFAALRESGAAEAELPDELPAAEPIPVAEAPAAVVEEPVGEVAMVPEPVDPIATHDAAASDVETTLGEPSEREEMVGELEAPSAEPTDTADVSQPIAAAGVAGAEPEWASAEPAEAAELPEPGPEVDRAAPIDLAQVPAPEPEVAPVEPTEFVEAGGSAVDADAAVMEREPAPEPAPEATAPEPAPEATGPVGQPQRETLEAASVAAAEEPVAEPPAPEVEAIEWDAERYTTAIEEPDWFAGESSPDWPSEEASPEPAPPEPEFDSEPEPEPSPEAFDDASGAAEMEVAPSGRTAATTETPSPPAQPAAASAEAMAPAEATAPAVAAAPAEATAPADEGRHARETLPGSSELDQALAALRELARSSSSPRGPEPSAPVDAAGGADEWPPRSASFEAAARPGGVPTRGPASRAYRRLRRIFPG